ncbi:JmjC domain-containing protein [Kitasatospora sp. NPDC087314]|uniref:JmjC domain-containing protein n=1 Tax=Kitasatospora sp. NPDC087314 TaxID=3364068 RepID=UPI00382E0A01
MNATEMHRWVGDVEEFDSIYWRREPAVFETAPPPPMSLDDIDAALAGGTLRSPHVEMVRAGKDIALNEYTEAREVRSQPTAGFADSRAILALLETGATLLLRNTEQWHRPTAELVARLADEVGRRVEAFFFVTPPGGQGLPVHRDDADVLLLQVAGSKRWTVRSGPSDHHWQAGEVSGDPGPVLLNTTVSKGQVLYIPRGFAHSAVGDQGLSAHLSLTVREIGGAHLTRAMPRLLLEGIRLPARPLEESGLLESATTLLEAARKRLADLEPSDLVRYARAIQRDQRLNNRDPASVAEFADRLTASANLKAQVKGLA